MKASLCCHLVSVSVSGSYYSLYVGPSSHVLPIAVTGPTAEACFCFLRVHPLLCSAEERCPAAAPVPLPGLAREGSATELPGAGGHDQSHQAEHGQQRGRQKHLDGGALPVSLRVSLILCTLRAGIDLLLDQAKANAPPATCCILCAQLLQLYAVKVHNSRGLHLEQTTAICFFVRLPPALSSVLHLACASCSLASCSLEICMVAMMCTRMCCLQQVTFSP